MSKTTESRFTGQVHFSHTVPEVWAFMTAPDLVSNCTPGLSEWQTLISNKSFQLLFIWETPAQSKLIFPTHLQWDQLQAPHRLQFSAVTEPKGFGAIRFSGEFHLVEQGSSDSTMTFTAVVQTTNPFINQLIKNVLPKQIDQFFQCVKSKL